MPSPHIFYISLIPAIVRACLSLLVYELSRFIHRALALQTLVRRKSTRTRGAKAVHVANITVTSEGLERSLASMPALKSAPGAEVHVADLTMEPLAGSSNGTTSDLYRIQITYAHAHTDPRPAGTGAGVGAVDMDLPQTLVLKAAKTHTLAHRISNTLSNAGVTDVAFYKAATANGALDAWGGGVVRVPKFYGGGGGGVTRVTGEATLVMEDLSEYYRYHCASSVHQVRTILDRYAWMHASFVEFHGETASAPSSPKLSSLTESLISDGADKYAYLCSSGWARIKGKGRALMLDEVKDTKMGDAVVRVMPALLGYLAAGPLTLLHGDAHSGNPFFTKPIDVPDSVSDPDVKMICADWQPATRGSPFCDAAYCIGAVQMSPSEKVEMAKIYTQRLRVHVQKLRGDAVARALRDWIPDEEAALVQFRLAFAASGRNVITGANFIRDWETIKVERRGEPGVFVFDECLKFDVSTGLEEDVPVSGKQIDKNLNSFKMIKYYASFLLALNVLDVLPTLLRFDSEISADI